MLRSTFHLLLVAIMLISTEGSIRKRWEIESRGNVSVTTIDSTLYAVSKNQTHISIQSNITSYQQCDLEFKNTHMGKIQVAGIEAKILLLFRLNSTTIQILQLDPLLCLYTPLPSLWTWQESNSKLQLTVSEDTLDIFVQNHINYLPYRLDVNGNRLGVAGQLKKSTSRLFKSFFVEELFQKGVVSNYVLAGNFYNGSSVIMVLDHNFTLTKDTYFGFRIEALATNSVSNQSMIGITYAGLGNPHERVLAMYTNNLELIYQTRVEHGRGDRVLDTMLSINSRGQAFVHSQQSRVPSDNYRNMNYAIYNSEGLLVASRAYLGLVMDTKYDWQLFRRNDEFCYVFHWEDKSLTITYVDCV